MTIDGMTIAVRSRGCLAHICEGDKIVIGPDLSKIVAAKVVDARKKACPGTLMETKKSIVELNQGEVLEVLSNDPEARNDIRSWAEKAGQDYLGHMEAKGYDRLFIARRQ